MMNTQETSNRTRVGPSPLVQLMLWVIIPSIVFAGLEFAARDPVFAHRWYTGIRNQAKDGPIDVMLVGSSRTAAAVDPALFEQLAEAATGRDVTVVMPAAAYAGIIGHSIAVEGLVEDHPEAFRDCTVFVEQPSGLPFAFVTWHEDSDRWEYEWAREDRAPQLLAEVLRPKDIVPFLLSATSVEVKVQLTLRWLAGGSYLVRYREIIRDKILGVGRDIMRDRIIPRVCTIEGPVEVEQGDLADRGGIRRGAAAIANAREVSLNRTTAMLKNQAPLRPWEGTKLARMIDTVLTNGGNVVFFNMPESTYYARTKDTEIRRADKERFRAWARARHVPIIDPKYEVADEYFPDLLHLAKSKSAAYTEALVQAWLADPAVAVSVGARQHTQRLGRGDPYRSKSTMTQPYEQFNRAALHVDIYDKQTALQYTARRNDIPYFVQHAQRSGGPVLELAAGTGRVVWPIAEGGHIRCWLGPVTNDARPRGGQAGNRYARSGQALPVRGRRHDRLLAR